MSDDKCTPISEWPPPEDNDVCEKEVELRFFLHISVFRWKAASANQSRTDLSLCAKRKLNPLQSLWK